MTRWIIPELATMNADQLRAFANGCAILACVKGNLDKAKAQLDTLPPKYMPDTLVAIKLLDRPDPHFLTRQKFLRGD